MSKPQKILFVHQNFPGQFKHLAAALAADPAYEVAAFICGPQPTVTATATSTDAAAKPDTWQGVQLHRWQPARSNTPGLHPWLVDFETKTIRGEAVFKAALALRTATGYVPDAIVAHPGWGESLFLKEVWPEARLGIYCEFFYHAQGADVGFDAEFPVAGGLPSESCRLQIKNAYHLLQFQSADAGISPTHWQASTFPEPFKSRIRVIHDGIDTEKVKPHPAVEMQLSSGTMGNPIPVRLRRLDAGGPDEIITFVNRNLEPYRGYHIFMRALPEILRQRPRARVLIVGGDGVSYGAKPPAPAYANGAGPPSWKTIFHNEITPQLTPEMQARIHFLGLVPYPQFLALLQLSTVHVYWSYPFVLSWSLLEAMAAGCAIVASDTAPLHEAIRHSDTGLLVDFFDIAGLAKTVCDLLAQPEAERARLGQQARAFVQATYDLKTVCLPQQRQWVQELLQLPDEAKKRDYFDK